MGKIPQTFERFKYLERNTVFLERNFFQNLSTDRPDFLHHPINEDRVYVNQIDYCRVSDALLQQFDFFLVLRVVIQGVNHQIERQHHCHQEN